MKACDVFIAGRQKFCASRKEKAMKKTATLLAALLVAAVPAVSLFASCTKDEEKKMKGRKSKTVCSCCKTCGLIQNIRAVELDKIVQERLKQE